MIQIIPDFTTDQTLTISIIDMAGKLVFQEQKTASGTFSIEPQLTGGLYFMEISDGNGLKFHEKLIRK
jgi:hypothetical protein